MVESVPSSMMPGATSRGGVRMGYASYERPVRAGAGARAVEVEVVEVDIARWVVCADWGWDAGMGADVVVGIGRGGIGAARSCDSGYVYMARVGGGRARGWG